MFNINFKYALLFYISIFSSHLLCGHLSKDDEYTRFIKKTLKDAARSKKEQKQKLRGIETQKQAREYVYEYTKNLPIEKFIQNHLPVRFATDEEEIEYRKNVIEGFDHYNDLEKLSEEQAIDFLDDLHYALFRFKDKGHLSLFLAAKAFFLSYSRNSKNKNSIINF